MTINESFKQSLRNAMRVKGYTQAEVAERAGISQRAVSTYTSGERMPRYEQLPALAEALGISVTELLGLTNDNYSPTAAHVAYLFDKLDKRGQSVILSVLAVEVLNSKSNS